MKSSTSASVSKKRKISHDNDDDDNEDDENMEKFYALINNIRETRDRFITNNSSASASVEIVKKNADTVDDRSETKKRKLEEDQEKQPVAWNPSFRLEDSMDKADNKVKDQPLISFAGTSQSKDSDHNDRKEEVKDELDLTLSL